MSPENAWLREFERLADDAPEAADGEGQKSEDAPRLSPGQVRGLLEYYLGARRLDDPERWRRRPDAVGAGR